MAILKLTKHSLITKDYLCNRCGEAFRAKVLANRHLLEKHFDELVTVRITNTGRKANQK